MKGRRNMGIIVIAILVVPIIFLSSVGYLATTDNPGVGSDVITITDDRDKDVTLPKYPQRIVSLGSSFTEVLFAIGAGDQIVGVDSTSKYPPEALNRTENVGSGYSINQEVIINLTPDCIVIWSYVEGGIKNLEELGLPVLAFYPHTIDDIMSVVERLGKATGHEEEADACLHHMRTVIENVTDVVEHIPTEKRPKVYFENANEELRAAGNGTIANELITLAGGLNIFADKEGYFRATSEDVIAQNPDIIIVENQSSVTNEAFGDRGGWDTMEAVESGRIYRINRELVSSTPRVVEALMQFAEWLHPDLFLESPVPFEALSGGDTISIT